MKFLILNNQLHAYTGSEINALQISKALMDLGHTVDAATFISDSPMLEMFHAIGVKVDNLLENSSEPMEYDVIWAHHAPVLTHLIYKRNIADAKILFSSLAPIEPRESPPFYLDQIPLFLSNSLGNTQKLISHGVAEDKIHYFPNYAPRHFFTQCKSIQPAEVKKIAVVSNHPPQEVCDMAQIAAQAGVQVDFYGQQGQQRFVDEALLLPYDLVISIGKTVQYCFALKVPVYCYDHFGGPGYIHPGNFSITESTNFSGRTLNRKLGAQELYADIFSRFQDGLEFLDFLYEKGLEKFCLETNLEKVLSRVEAMPVTRISAVRQANAVVERHNDIYVNELKDRVYAYSELRKRTKVIEDLSKELAEKELKVAQLNAILSSKAWKVASFLQMARKKIAPEQSFRFRVLQFFYGVLFKKSISRKE